MDFVDNWEDIARNLETLERYRTSGNGRESEFYKSRITQGICFVIWLDGDRTLLGPARFVGYLNNTIAAHEANKTKHGGPARRTISTVLGTEPVDDQALEEQYRRYCMDNGLRPRRAGAFSTRRKYWLHR